MESNRKEVERIRASYTEKGTDKLSELKKLDSKAKLPATVFAYVFGIAGALILGTGMCLAMKIIGNLMPLGIVIGCIGIAMISVNYLFYSFILKSSKRKFSEKISSLSAEILGE